MRFSRTNAGSFAFALASLAAVDAKTLEPAATAARAKRQLLDGIRYAVRTPEVRWPRLMTALQTMLALQYPVILPVMATAFHGGARAFGLMFAVAVAGALTGGLAGARRDHMQLRAVRLPAAIAAGAAVAAALVAKLGVELPALLVVGWGGLVLAVRTWVIPQQHAPDAMGGRVMALWNVVTYGGTALGAPILGAAISHTSARVGPGLAAAAYLIIFALAMIAALREHTLRRHIANQPRRWARMPSRRRLSRTRWHQSDTSNSQKKGRRSSERRPLFATMLEWSSKVAVLHKYFAAGDSDPRRAPTTALRG